jgi:uncharacterized membrane protein
MFSNACRWAGFLLGFALGGFFDGILLHQVLQWHHLLSGLEGSAFRDLRVQVLADGLFHALMYVLAGVGLWLLCRARGELADPRADRVLLATALLGFGAWHVADGVLSHWILQIHRIRMDTANPLVWDLIWFFVFGVAFLAAGWLLQRRTGAAGTPGGRRRALTCVALALVTPIAGALAALPPAGIVSTAVLFRPGKSAGEALAAVAAVDGQPLWSDASGQLWVVHLPNAAAAWGLYRHGALVVGGSILPAGCLSWLRAT